MGSKRANQRSTSKAASGRPRRARERADDDAEQAAMAGGAQGMDVDHPERNTRSRAREGNRQSGGLTTGGGDGVCGGEDEGEAGGDVEGNGIDAVDEGAMEVDPPPAPIRRSARQAGVRAPSPIDAPTTRGATSTKANAALPAKGRAKGAGAMDVDAPFLSTKVGPPTKVKPAPKAHKPIGSSARSDGSHSANARVGDAHSGSQPRRGRNPPLRDDRGSPSVRGPSPRRSASVSRPSGESQSSRLVLDYVDVPTSRRGPSHAQPLPSPSRSPVLDPPSSPPADTPPQSDDSDDDDPTDDFDPDNASGPEPESDSNRSSGDEEGYATPTPRPRKRSPPSGDSPSTARPQSKRPRPATKGGKGKGSIKLASFDADIEDLFGGGSIGNRHPPSPAKKKKAKRKSRSPSTDLGTDLSPPPRPKRKKKSKAKSPSPQPGASADGEDRPPRKNKGKGKAPPPPPDDDDESNGGDDHGRGRGGPSRKDKGKGKAPPPPSDDDGEGDGGDDHGRGRGGPSRKDKGKGKAPPPPSDDDDESNGGDDHGRGRGGPSHRAKGKGRAPPEDGQPSNIPGVFNPGDYLADDAELPSLDDFIAFSPEPDLTEPGPSTRRDTRRRRQEPEQDVPAYAPGRLPDEARSKAAEKGINYILELQAIAQEYNKPLDVVFRLAGWMHSDSAHARRWQRANVFRRFWAATNPMDDTVSSEERRAQMDAAYREKMAELGPNPTASQLMDHFKKEYDYCVEMDQRLIDNLTSRQRQRQIDSLAQQFSRLALAANLNNGVAVVGYVVDLSGRANSGMFGGGPVYDELLRRYSGNFGRGLEDMSTMLRACDLRLRGLHEDGDSPAIALEDPVEGWFPVRDWSLDPDQNKSDEYLRILYELLRWDLGAIYLMANERLSSRHTAIEPRQFPRALWPDIAYRLGVCLVNWPEALRRNMPAKDLKRKPSGRSWSSIVAGMVNYRRRGEAESNRRGLREEEALRFLLGLGVPALVPLPADYALLPHQLLGNNPIVQSPRPPLSAEARVRRPRSFLQWRDSARYLKDRREGTDSRIKWQSYWGAERNNGLVRDDDTSNNGDARASTEGISPRNINHPSPNSWNNLWAPWTRVESPSRLNRLSHASHLARVNRLQMDDDEDEDETSEGWEYMDGEDSGGEQVSAAARADALHRLKRARESNPRISSKSKGSSKGEGSSKAAGPSKSSKGGKSSKGDKPDKSSKDGAKRK